MYIPTIPTFATLARITLKLICVALLTLPATLQAEDQQRPTSRTNYPIGFLGGLTGQYASVANGMLSGAELAAHDCNERLVKYNAQVSIVAEDDGMADNKTTLTAIKKFAQIDKVVAILAWAFSTANTIKTGLNNQPIPVLFFWDANAGIPALGKNFYGTGPSMEMLVQSLSQVLTSRSIGKLGTIVLVDNWAERMHKLLSEQLPKNDIEIVTTESVLPDASDLRTPLLRIRNAHPDALLILSYGPTLITAIKQAKQIWPEVRIFSFGQPESDMRSAGASAEGTVIINGWANGAIADRMSAAISAKQKANASSSQPLSPTDIAYSIYAYTSAALVCEAIEDLLAQGTPVTNESLNTQLGVVSFDAGVGEVAPGRYNHIKEIPLEWRSGKFTPVVSLPLLPSPLPSALPSSR